MLKHPAQARYIELLKEQRRNSRRALGRCKRSVTCYEKHLCLIEESEEVLLRLGVITKADLFEGV